MSMYPPVTLHSYPQQQLQQQSFLNDLLNRPMDLRSGYVGEGRRLFVVNSTNTVQSRPVVVTATAPLQRAPTDAILDEILEQVIDIVPDTPFIDNIGSLHGPENMIQRPVTTKIASVSELAKINAIQKDLMEYETATTILHNSNLDTIGDILGLLESDTISTPVTSVKDVAKIKAIQKELMQLETALGSKTSSAFSDSGHCTSSVWTQQSSTMVRKIQSEISSTNQGSGKTRSATTKRSSAYINDNNDEDVVPTKSVRVDKPHETRSKGLPNLPQYNGNAPFTTTFEANQCNPNLEVNVVYNLEDTQCSFCCDDLEKGEGIMLQTCLHIFCKNCLTTAIESETTNTMKCLLSKETPCNGYLLDREIKSIVSKQSYEEYIGRGFRLALSSMENIYHCKTERCPGLCQYESGRKTFDCTFCHKTNCVPCKNQHEGLSCEEYQKMLNDALAQGETLESALRLIKTEVMKNGWSQLAGTFAGLKERSNNSLLEDIAKRDLLLTTQEFECSICFMEVAVGNGVILPDCLHTFCRDCLLQTIQYSEDIDVKCPYVKSNYSCNCVIQPREIKALLPKEMYETYLSRSVKQAEGVSANTFHCKTPDCPGWYFVEGEQYGVFICDVCKNENCLKHKVCHVNLSCEDYENRLVQNENDLKTQSALKDMVKKGLAMICPKCKMTVQKISGCDAVRCSVCRAYLCWATKGLRWGPKGPGDNSAGCQCGVRKRCHPRCKGCSVFHN